MHMNTRHLLATKQGISAMLAVLLAAGDMCPECGHGTRATSKRWARCKACGARVARHSIQVLKEKES
jgi:tRNA(Ile2) C34 agmatinyltransferase TiaS